MGCLSKEGGMHMAERTQEQIIKNIGKALPNLDESQTQYLLGYTEGLALVRPKKKKKGEQ